jgi:mono/diheme cytochrome c family protein
MFRSFLPIFAFVALAACSSDATTTDGGATSDDGGTTPVTDSSTPVTDSSTPVTDSSTKADASVAPTFTNVYANVVQGACSSCHVANHSTGLNLSTKAAAYTNLVDKASGTGGTTSCAGKVRVTPSAPAASLFWTKIDHSAGCGNPMPLAGNKLSADKIKLVADWINAGAKDD